MAIKFVDACRQLLHFALGPLGLLVVNQVKDAAAHFAGSVRGAADGKEIFQLLHPFVHFTEQRHHVDCRFMCLDRMFFHIGTQAT